MRRHQRDRFRQLFTTKSKCVEQNNLPEVLTGSKILHLMKKAYVPFQK
jgi:hypothetical protein